MSRNVWMSDMLVYVHVYYMYMYTVEHIIIPVWTAGYYCEGDSVSGERLPTPSMESNGVNPVA